MKLEEEKKKDGVGYHIHVEAGIEDMNNCLKN